LQTDAIDLCDHLTGEWSAVNRSVDLLTGPRELDILRCDPGSLRVRCNSIS
jgi:hypothetical protein